MQTHTEISKRLYYLQTDTIATRRNVTSDFHIHFRNVIVHAKGLNCMPENWHQWGF